MIFHTVRNGETVYEIAKEYGVNADQLLRENPQIEPDALAVGEVLILYQPLIEYMVRRGDTLASIAERTGTSVGELYRLNPILGGRDAILAGQTLVVKARETPTRDLRTRGILSADTATAILRAQLPYLTELLLTDYDEESLKRVQSLAAEYRVSVLRYLDTVPRDTEEAVAKETATLGFRGLAIGDCSAAVCPRLGEALGRMKLGFSCDVIPGEMAESCDAVTVIAYAGEGRYFFTPEAAKTALAENAGKTRWFGYPGFAEARASDDPQNPLRFSSCLALPLCRDFGAEISHAENGMAEATLSLGQGDSYALTFCDGLSVARALDVIEKTGAEGLSVWQTRCFDPVLWQAVNLRFRIVKDE